MKKIKLIIKHIQFLNKNTKISFSSIPLSKLFLPLIYCCLFYSCDSDLQVLKIDQIDEDKVGLVGLVSPFIGTAGDHGQLSSAASLPFERGKLGPETNPTNHEGYDYNANKFKGFTHNRSEGVGCKGADGNILIKPGMGPSKTFEFSYD